jgi:hypothetical protein
MKDPNLVKRARAKYFTLAFLYPLIDLQGANNKKYWSAWHCSRILKVTDYETFSKVQGKYCKQRFCTVCNRIRTANYINSYTKVINTFSEPYMLTLTLRNCKGKDLRFTIQQMQSFFRYFNKQQTKAGYKNKYLRKLEVTFNHDKTTYHPHYHIVTENKPLADRILSDWLLFYGSATNLKAQNVKICDSNAKIELFKYFTDIIKKKDGIYKFEPLAFDLIISALDRIRIFQPVGIKKMTDPEQIELFSQEISEVLHESEYYYDERVADWVGFHNKTHLTGYKPSEKFKMMVESIGFDDRINGSEYKTHDVFTGTAKKDTNNILTPNKSFENGNRKNTKRYKFDTKRYKFDTN